MWTSRSEAFKAIVPTDVFLKARQIIDARHIHLSDEDLLTRLRSLLERCGKLSGILIDEAEDMPSSSTHMSRFGGLHRAHMSFRLVGATGETPALLKRTESCVDGIMTWVQIIRQAWDLRATGAHIECGRPLRPR